MHVCVVGLGLGQSGEYRAPKSESKSESKKSEMPNMTSLA